MTSKIPLLLEEVQNIADQRLLRSSVMMSHDEKERKQHLSTADITLEDVNCKLERSRAPIFLLGLNFAHGIHGIFQALMCSIFFKFALENILSAEVVKGKGKGILVLRRSTNGHFYPMLCSRRCIEYTLPSCQAMSTLYRG